MSKAKYPKLYGFGDACKFIGMASNNFLKLVKSKNIYFQQTSGGKIFFEPDLIRLKNERIAQAKTDKRVRLKK